MARFPGAFGYGVAGLGEGLAEGLFLGMEARRRKQEQERLKQGQAMQLLLGLFKATDDPDERQSLAAMVGPMYQKLSGQPLPQFPTTPPEQRAQREAAKFQQYQKAFMTSGMSEEEAKQYAGAALGLKVRQPGTPWIDMETGEVIGGHPWQRRAPQRDRLFDIPRDYYTPGTQGGPPVYQGTLPPGAMVGPVPFEQRKEIEQGYKQTQEPGTPASNQDIKDFHEAKRRLEDPSADPSTREEDLAIVSQYDGVTTKEETVKIPSGFISGAKEGKAIKVKAPPQLMKRRRLPTAGTAPRGGQTYDQLPDPATKKGKTFTNPVTGKKVRSDGTKWVPLN